MNICFEYVYRYAANYKNRGSVIFPGIKGQPLSSLEEIIRESLIDTEYFVAEEVSLPTLYFSEYDSGIDHSWHQFSALYWTDEIVNVESTLDELIQRLGAMKLACS